jgi:thioredoxin reductase (NADPH)
MEKKKLPPYDYDIVIIGGGPAGYTAGIYGARAGLKTLLIEGEASVSQITMTDLIENYPGFPDGLDGYGLMQLFKNQALKFGLEILPKDVTEISQNKPESPLWTVRAGSKIFKTLTIIAATGAHWSRLGIPGEMEFIGRGVSYCATCDGPFYRNREVIVAGGGDSAIQEALFLTHFATKVTVVHRRDRLRAADVLQKRAFAEKKIEFAWDSVLTEINGADLVTGVKVKNVKTNEIKSISADGVFIFVGRIPNTEIFKGVLNLDAHNYLITGENMATSATGIFAAGDCRAKLFRQVVTAAGDGANAAFSAELYIENVKGEAY